MARPTRSLIPIALLLLVMAVSSSVTIWGHVSSAAKIAFFCYGFGSGVATGAVLGSRRAARG